jgi:hypothetical protein
MSTIAKILTDVVDELGRQYDKWGLQHHPDGTTADSKGLADLARVITDAAAERGHLTWFDILTEEFREAGAEAEWPELRAELIQVAAVCISWIKDGDERP